MYVYVQHYLFMYFFLYYFIWLKIIYRHLRERDFFILVVNNIRFKCYFFIDGMKMHFKTFRNIYILFFSSMILNLLSTVYFNLNFPNSVGIFN